MDTILVKLCIRVRPIYHNDNPPNITVRVDKHILFSGDLLDDSNFAFSGNLENSEHCIVVEFSNKYDSDYDPINDLDKAVVIERVEFFGINSQYSLLSSEYTPIYSNAYIKTMHSSNTPLKNKLIACNYLGWNGTWCIKFNAPVFKWMYVTESLGWIYPSTVYQL